jgi:hypothetical protein
MKSADPFPKAMAARPSAHGAPLQDSSKPCPRVARLAAFLDSVVTARRLRASAASDRVRF